MSKKNVKFKNPSLHLKAIRYVNDVFYIALSEGKKITKEHALKVFKKYGIKA